MLQKKSKILSLIICILLSQSIIGKESETMNSDQSGSIKLYIYHNCPYCKKVITFLKTIGHMADVELIDASKPENRNALKKISGDTQCPYLVDEPKGVAMPESADIITYLKSRF